MRVSHWQKSTRVPGTGTKFMPSEFVHGFAGVDEEETRLLLLNMREQTQAALRDNVLVRAGGVHASHAISQ